MTATSSPWPRSQDSRFAWSPARTDHAVHATCTGRDAVSARSPRATNSTLPRLSGTGAPITPRRGRGKDVLMARVGAEYRHSHHRRQIQHQASAGASAGLLVPGIQASACGSQAAGFELLPSAGSTKDATRRAAVCAERGSVTGTPLAVAG